MEDCCLSLDDPELRESFCDRIRGSGAFRRFKDAVHHYGIADDWYKYRDNTLRQIAIEWHHENDIEFEDR